MSVRLYVGNLPKEPVDRQALQAMFADVGQEVSTKVIKDRRTGKCRGFAFVTVPTDEMADELIEKHNGQTFMDSPLRIEKALPRAKGKGDEAPDSAPAPSSSSNSGSSSGNPAPSRRSSGGSGSGKARRSSNNSSSSSDSVQPDPRWADELAKLKEMLAQTTNS